MSSCKDYAILMNCVDATEAQLQVYASALHANSKGRQILEVCARI